MEELPFEEVFLPEENCWLRTWPESISPDEMKWHIDTEDRTFVVVTSDGWKFQRDNQLPIDMKPGDKIEVKEGEYHRGIKGLGPLVIKLFKY